MVSYSSCVHKKLWFYCEYHDSQRNIGPVRSCIFGVCSSKANMVQHCWPKQCCTMLDENFKQVKTQANIIQHGVQTRRTCWIQQSWMMLDQHVGFFERALMVKVFVNWKVVTSQRITVFYALKFFTIFAVYPVSLSLFQRFILQPAFHPCFCFRHSVSALYPNPFAETLIWSLLRKSVDFPNN